MFAASVRRMRPGGENFQRHCRSASSATWPAEMEARQKAFPAVKQSVFFVALARQRIAKARQFCSFCLESFQKSGRMP